MGQQHTAAKLLLGRKTPMHARWNRKHQLCSGNRRAAANLDCDSGDDGLGVNEGGVAQVVEAVGGEDLRACFEPHRLLELHTSVFLLRGGTTTLPPFIYLTMC